MSYLRNLNMGKTKTVFVGRRCNEQKRVLLFCCTYQGVYFKLRRELRLKIFYFNLTPVSFLVITRYSALDTRLNKYLQCFSIILLLNIFMQYLCIVKMHALLFVHCICPPKKVEHHMKLYLFYYLI